MIRRGRALDGLDEEIRDHIERESQEGIDRGLPPEEARRQAMLKFGNVVLAKEDTRAVWFSRWAEQLVQDARYALRSMRRNPLFAAVTVLTLAVGIGMTTAVFSVFNAVILRPVAYPEPDRLVWMSTVGTDGEAGIVTGPDFVDWHEQASSFDRMVAYYNVDETVVVAGEASRARIARVTEDFWDLAGARPAMGRLPASRERDVVLLSDRFARRLFPGEPDIVGRPVTLNGDAVTVIGVLPEAFRFHFPRSPWPGFRPRDVDIYRPAALSAARGGPMQLLNVVGRVKPDVTLARAHAELESIRARIAQAHPNPFSDQRTLRTAPLQEQLVGSARLGLVVLLTAVALVLLMACGNAANLLLARASTRRREIAIRASVGAGRGRVLRQLLTESLLLALLASGIGLLLARLALAVALRVGSDAIPRMAEATVDTRVLAVALGLSVLTALLFGLAPALVLRRVDPNETLKDGTTTVSAPASAFRTRKVLVGAQLAVALMLLIGAGLMLKSVWQMTGYPPGFEPQRILTAKVEFSGREYDEPRRQIAFADALLQGLDREPGVVAASISTLGDIRTHGLIVDGRPAPSPEELASQELIMINVTSAGFNRVVGLRMAHGRWFRDDAPEVVLNEGLARREFAGENPIGRRLRLTEEGPLLTIVGVVADLRYSALDAPPEPEMYVPYSHSGGLFGFSALILTAGDPMVLAPAVHNIVAGIDRTQVADETMTLEQALADSIAPRRMNLFLLGTFAASALLLAMIGVYGITAYSVTQRTQEIGVRLALGARCRDVVRLVLHHGMRLTLTGVAAGVIGALLLTRFLAGLLYSVEATDLQTFVVVTLAVATTALIACCVPAVRAARLNPISALRAN